MDIHVVTVGQGRTYDLSGLAEGLRYSNVNPGGDERCTFELKRSWFAGAPEISIGNVVRVADGVNVLWQGRAEENDRQVANAEMIGVTAFGSGVALKDSAYPEIYVDRDLSAWGELTRTFRLAAMAAGRSFGANEVAPDAAGLPGIDLMIQGVIQKSVAGAVYDAGSVAKIAAIYYDFVAGANVNVADANWAWDVTVAPNDDITGGLGTGNLRAASGSGYFTPATPNRYALIELFYGAAAAGASGTTYDVMFRKPAVYGNHALTRRGADPGGFYTSDLVGDVIGRQSAVRKRRIDGLQTIVGQLVDARGKTHEDWVREISRYESVDWGTWGPESAFDTYTGGYFDWKARDLATQHWYALRSQCQNIALNVELSTLYNAVDVYYTDETGRQQVVTRTRNVPALTAAGITTKKPPGGIDGGTLTTAMAQTLGDVFLLLNSGDPPARGSFTIRGCATHYQRGKRSVQYMRADGSNIRVPDVLPSSSALALTTAPDRRTTFPIKRIEVDASGPTPEATVSVDQTDDRFAVLQARMNLAAQILGF